MSDEPRTLAPPDDFDTVPARGYADAPVVGRMTITFHDNGTSKPAPIVTFDPVGRITPGLIDSYIPYICTAVNQAQSAVRHAARTGGTIASVAPPARRNA